MIRAAPLREREALDGVEADDMIRRARAFIARMGPATTTELCKRGLLRREARCVQLAAAP